MDVTSSPPNRDHRDEKPNGVLKTISDVAKRNTYLSTLEKRKETNCMLTELRNMRQLVSLTFIKMSPNWESFTEVRKKKHR